MKTVFPNFFVAIKEAQSGFLYLDKVVESNTWQGVDVSSKPEMSTYEVFNHSLCVVLPHEDLSEYRADINPNIPWADDHFEERICGLPLNPGEQWAKWPYAHSADKFRNSGGQFNHTYMERYWPKWANRRSDDVSQNTGIRGQYGDLNNIVEQLIKDPLTRQAYLPIFFPEDTGAINGGRIPCTLGYHFIMRYNYLHIVYYIRSCDFVRHFRDDIYLSIRLLLWVLDRLREKDDNWREVDPGSFTMHITSLHMFRNDWNSIFGGVNDGTVS